MKIWEVVENDHQMRFYFYATKAEALKHVREYEPPEGWQGTPPVPEIKSFDVEPTRKGIASALNWLMTFTCFNEG